MSADDIKKWKAIYTGLEDHFNEEEKKVGEVISHVQPILFAKWKKGAKDEKKQKAMLHQMGEIEAALEPMGGMKGYHTKIHKLMKQASGEKYHPYGSHVVASVPDGMVLSDATKEEMDKIHDMEAKGLAEVGATAFVLAAGGKGHRLGYKGNKMTSLHADLARDEPLLKHYIDHILAFQTAAREQKSNSNCVLPLVIMTSDDTHAHIEEALEQNNNFGMANGQITLIKQAKVFAVKDTECHYLTNAKDQYHVELGHHGSGAVHMLLGMQTALMETWQKKNIKYVFFFGDNNLLALHGLMSTLGVSATNNYALNHMTVPRRPEVDKSMEPLCRIAKKKTPEEYFTVPVPAELVEDLFKSGKVQDKLAEGVSAFPASTGSCVVDFKAYQTFLTDTKGEVRPHVLPVWKDKKKGTLKQNCWMECYMNELELPRESVTGFTQLPEWMCYAPFHVGAEEAKAMAKSNTRINSLPSAEHNLFHYYRKSIGHLTGMNIDVEGKESTYCGMPAPHASCPRVLFSASFGVTLAEIANKFTPLVNPSSDPAAGVAVTIAPKSTLVLSGRGVCVAGLTVDGVLCVDATDTAIVNIDNLSVENKGWDVAKIKDKKRAKSKDPNQQVRGYHLNRKEKERSFRVKYTEPGVFDLFRESQVGRGVDEEDEPEEEEIRPRTGRRTGSTTPDVSARKEAEDGGSANSSRPATRPGTGRESKKGSPRKSPRKKAN